MSSRRFRCSWRSRLPGSSQGQVLWQVQLQLDSSGSATQRKLSSAMAGDQTKLFAIAPISQPSADAAAAAVRADSASSRT